MRTINVLVPAGQSRTVPMDAGVLICEQSSGVVSMRLNGGRVVEGWQAGKSYRVHPGGERITRAIFEAAAGGPDVSLQLYVGDDQITDTRMQVAADAEMGLASYAQLVALPSVTVGAGVSAELAAADPSRRVLVVTNLADHMVWLRHGAAYVASGIPLQRGQSYTGPVYGEVWGYNPDPDNSAFLAVAEYR